MKLFSLLILFCCFFVLPTLSNAQIVGKSLKLSKKQLKSLNKGLPEKVRSFLETSDKFEVFVQGEKKNGKIVTKEDEGYMPNIKAEIKDKTLRNKLLTAFYKDALFGYEASCYLPNHTILATKGNEKVEIEICFGCSRFYGKGSLGEFKGALSGEQSMKILNEVLANEGVDIK